MNTKITDLHKGQINYDLHPSMHKVASVKIGGKRLAKEDYAIQLILKNVPEKNMYDGIEITVKGIGKRLKLSSRGEDSLVKFWLGVLNKVTTGARICVPVVTRKGMKQLCFEKIDVVKAIMKMAHVK